MPSMLRYGCLLLVGLLTVTLLEGCYYDESTSSGPPVAGGEAGATLTVFAAASLANAFTAIEAAFEEAHPGIEVVLHLAGSQQLAQQLRLGAPADVFASASQRHLQIAVEAGRIEPVGGQLFARNRLVVVMPRDNPARLSRLQDLARPDLRLVMAAEEVPAGRYARAFLEKASDEGAFGPAYGPRVLASVVSYEQNVRAVLTKVALGEADAGVVYASDLVGADAEALRWIEIPEAYNVEAVYPMAPVAGSAHPELALAFVIFVLSSEGQEILTRYGFTLAGTS